MGGGVVWFRRWLLMFPSYTHTHGQGKRVHYGVLREEGRKKEGVVAVEGEKNLPLLLLFFSPLETER